MTTTILFGELRTGRITGTLDATGCNWEQTLNDAGSIDGVTVQGHEVRSKRLRQECMAARSYLAVDVDGVIQEAGPLWSRRWNASRQQLTMTARGLWSLFDHRMVLPVLAAGQKVQGVSTVVAGTDLGGIARALVAQAVTHAGGSLPLTLPTAAVGGRTETYAGWELPRLGEELRQLTKREVAAPDIRFQPSYSTDKLRVVWTMQTGTETAPLLTQTGDDWYFDASVPRSNVLDIDTNEDATTQGSRSWTTGNGMEADILIGTDYDPYLINAGWPLLELEEIHSAEADQATLNAYAQAQVDRSSRPVETWSLRTTSVAGRDVLAGDYCQIRPKTDDPWLGENGDAYMRVKTKAGSLSDDVTLTMYDVAGQVS